MHAMRGLNLSDAQKRAAYDRFGAGAKFGKVVLVAP